jgi:hypothetical protein
LKIPENGWHPNSKFLWASIRWIVFEERKKHKLKQVQKLSEKLIDCDYLAISLKLHNC